MEHTIRPGKTWLDTEGNRIQAHGACVYYEDGVYYWIGEDKSKTRKHGKLWTYGINLYTSTDLCNWSYQGHIIEPVPNDPQSLFHPNRRMDRPHILKNETTGKYVLWLKYCDDAHATVLTANSIRGPYTVVNPVLHPFGTKFGDFDLAKDETTGQGYVYFEADHDKVIGCKLTEDYCNVIGEPVLIYSGLTPPYTREGITHFTRGGKHYLLSSGMIGYVPNPSECAIADDFLGPYTVQGNPHVNDTSSASFNSQISGVFRIAGTDTYVTVADRWVPYFEMTKDRYESLERVIRSYYDKKAKASLRDVLQMLRSPVMGSANTSIAEYVWLPIRFEGDTVRIDWKDEWSPNKCR